MLVRQWINLLSTKVRPNKKYKTDRPGLDGGSIKDLSKMLTDIVSNPQKYKNYQQDLAKYAWQQAGIFDYSGTLNDFLASLNLSHIFQKGTGMVDKALKSGVAGSPYQVDVKKGIQLLKDPDLWKIPSMKKRVDALHRSYDAVKRLGFKGSYTNFAKTIGAVQKPYFYFSRVWWGQQGASFSWTGRW